VRVAIVIAGASGRGDGANGLPAFASLAAPAENRPHDRLEGVQVQRHRVDAAATGHRRPADAAEPADAPKVDRLSNVPPVVEARVVNAGKDDRKRPRRVSGPHHVDAMAGQEFWRQQALLVAEKLAAAARVASVHVGGEALKAGAVRRGNGIPRLG